MKKFNENIVGSADILFNRLLSGKERWRVREVLANVEIIDYFNILASYKSSKTGVKIWLDGHYDEDVLLGVLRALAGFAPVSEGVVSIYMRDDEAAPFLRFVYEDGVWAEKKEE